jgi:tetratricopeptide (TPR) repeat protein
VRERRYREGELAALRGLQWTPNPFIYRILASARFRQGKVADALETVDAGAKRFPNSLLLPTARIEIAEATGHYQTADSLAHALPHNRGSTTLLLNQGLTDALVGKSAEAQLHLADLRRLQMSAGLWEPSIRTLVQLARVNLEVLQDTSRAIAVLDSGIAQSHWNEIDARERPYLSVAHFFLLAGRSDRAAVLIDEDNRNVGLAFRARGQWLRRRDKAMLRVARGDRSAVDDLRLDIETDASPMAAIADLFWSYRKLGDRKGAENAAKSYVAEINSQRLEDDAFNLVRMLEFLKESALNDGRTGDARQFDARRKSLLAASVPPR